MAQTESNLITKGVALAHPSPRPKPGPDQILEIWEPGNPEIWGPTNGKMKIRKIQIRSAQNVGKAWISREKILPALFGAIPGHFLHGPKNPKNAKQMHIFLGGFPKEQNSKIPRFPDASATQTLKSRSRLLPCTQG